MAAASKPAGGAELPALGDFEGLLAFYMAFHSDSVNQGIHLVFIPLIMWSALVGMTAIPTPRALARVGGFPALITAAYSAYYVKLNPALGLAWTGTLGAGVFAGACKYAAGAASGGGALKTAGYVRVSSWLAQFLGHGVFERRAPSIFTGIAHSLLAAPFFVFVETAFALGFMPELHKRVKGRADQIRKALDEAKKSK